MAGSSRLTWPALMAAIDFSDWNHDRYHYIDVRWNGTVGRVGVWDACRNEDCPDHTQCCTDNKQRFAQPGYLVDIETRTAQRLFGKPGYFAEIDVAAAKGTAPAQLISAIGSKLSPGSEVVTSAASSASRAIAGPPTTASRQPRLPQ